MHSVQTHDMTEGPLAKQIMVFSIPLIFTNLLQVFFSIADVAIVGRFSGTVALGAVGSTAILITMFTGFLMGIGGGINVLTARYIGEKDKQSLSETIHTASIVALFFGILFLVIAHGLGRVILSIMNTKPDYLNDAVTYLRMYSLGMPALALYNFGSAVLSAAGDTKRPMLYLTFAGILNVLMNLIFVLLFHMSAAGVGLASALSQYAAAGLVLAALIKEKSGIRLSFRKIRLNKEKAKALLALGIPSGAQNSIFALANIIIQSAVNSFDAVTVAGISASMNADSIVYDVMAAFYTAASSFMSQNYGAKKPRRILQSYKLCVAYSTVAAILFSAVLLLIGKSFLMIFTADPNVAQAGMQRMTIMCISYAFSGLMDCTIAASRGLGKSFGPMIIVMLGSCVFRVIWVYTIFAIFHTVLSLYLLYIFSWTLTGLAELWYFLKICKEKGILPAAQHSSVNIP